MDIIIPEKLKKGDEIRVIAPSTNMSILGEDTLKYAMQSFEKMGLIVSFGKNVYKSFNDNYLCASIEDRVSDFHDAIRDPNVKAILTAIGGDNSNQLLDYIDYELIKSNPKIICGYSDITALLDSIYARTGLVTYYGPHYSSFGMKYGKEYIEDYFKNMLFDNKQIDIICSKEWSNDLWFLNQEDRCFINNNGLLIINDGNAYGKIIGGNLCTLNLLQGSSYMPKCEDVILFIEENGAAGNNFLKDFDRNFQSLVHSIGIKNIKGIVIGRTELCSNMNDDLWKLIFKFRTEFNNIPIVANADFGHTTPMFTFPIGGYAFINTNKKSIISISDN